MSSEPVLDQFLGDDDFPVSGRRTPRRTSSGSTTTCTARTRVSPMFFDIGGWWLSLRPHVPPLRHAVRRRLAGQERQRLRLHRRPIPADPELRVDGTEYGARYGGARAARRRLRARRWARYLDARPARSTASSSPTGGATGWCRRCCATSRTWRRSLDARRRDEPGRAGRPARGRHRHPRPALEDPLDAQLRPAVGDAEPARGHGEDPRLGRRGAARPAAELGRGPQLGLRRGACGG